MRLSLLSNDGGIAELLINKAMELMSQAATAAAEDGKIARPNGDDRDRGQGEPR